MKHFQSTLIIAGTLAVALLQYSARGASAASPSESQVPVFAVDPYWPKPLPKNLIMGELSGVFVDAHDHVWVISRPRTLTDDEKGAAVQPPTSECCVPAPPVIEFDEAGNYIQGWGGAGDGYQWPQNEHGIFVDHRGNVWIGGNTTSGTNQPVTTDNQILKFSHEGKFLLQIGHAGESHGSNDRENLNRPAQICVYEKANEVFVADGYQNRRIVIFDADTGKYKRHWGAYGNAPDDTAPRTRLFEGPAPQQFNVVHGVRISRDDLVYVSDRVNNRIQVFTPAGKFVKEGFVARKTLDPRGTAFEVAFSPDAGQRFLYVPDGGNYKVRILIRETLAEAGSFGRMGPYAGQWHWLHSIAVDSKGNLYTAEARGNRIQKFALKGFRSASGNQ